MYYTYRFGHTYDTDSSWSKINSFTSTCFVLVTHIYCGSGLVDEIKTVCLNPAIVAAFMSGNTNTMLRYTMAMQCMEPN